jgi:hypothetical protein
MTSISRPLNDEACAAADEDIYAAHENDPRPNPLYDAQGNRLPLSATDPAHADLREEWFDLYNQHDGETDEPDDQPETPPGEDTIIPCPEDDDEPDPTIEVRWSKDEVLPIHNSSYPPSSAPTDVIPDDAKSQMIVDTTIVPDGTSASINVRHCVTGALVKDGAFSGFVVQGGKVIDPATGDRPFFTWDASKDPWSIWDKPFYYFDVSISYKGLYAETPKDFGAKAAECCRVLYWTVSFADSTSGLAGVLPEANNVKAAMDDAGLKSRCDVNNTTGHTAQANLGSLIRNTYAFHEGSHGMVVDRSNHLPTNHWQDGSVNPPSYSYSGPLGALPLNAWQSVMAIGSHTPASVNGPPTSQYPTGATWGADQIGDDQIGVTANYPSVPKVLFYCSCCVAGWEDSLGKAIVSRGCQNVIAFRKFVPDNDAAAMGRKVFQEWAKKKLDPAKVPDIFYSVGGPYYGSMRPVLFGKSAGAAGTSAATIGETVSETVDELITGGVNLISSYF